MRAILPAAPAALALVLASAVPAPVRAQPKAPP